jgi:hypothetical protein
MIHTYRHIYLRLLAALALVLTLGFPSETSFAQGTAFTYQGKLDSNGTPYTGSAEFQPTLWTAQSGGSQVAANTPASVVLNVTNGLFVLPLDFGANFAGADRWLQLDVRTALGSFNTLTPRQQLTPSPYAMYSANAGTAATAATATSVPAANLTGTLSLTQLPPTVLTNTQSGVNLTGSFNGNGGGLSNLNSSALTLGSSNVSITSWGWNDFGQRNIPLGLTGVTAVAAGIAHSLALKSDGTVVAWGAGMTNDFGTGVDYGQAIVPPGLSGVKGISAGYLHSAVVKSNGTVVAWGLYLYGQTNVPAGLNNAVAVAAGGYHTLALKADGTVAVWGTNYYGALDVPPGLTSVKMISAGLYHNLVLNSNGTVVAWGGTTNTADFGQSIVPPGLANVVAVSAGGAHSLALKSDGTVVAWGAGTSNNPVDGVNYGQSIVPPGLNNVVAISAGLYHSIALKADGTVVAWGGDSAYQSTNVPAGLDNVVALAQGSTARHGLVLRKQAAAPVAWLDSDNTFNGNIEANGEIRANGNLRVGGEMFAGGGLRLNDSNLWLRGNSDVNNGLGWFGAGKSTGPSGDLIPNGPFLFGEGGGAVGSMVGGSGRIALMWDAFQRVGIGTTNPSTLFSLGSGNGRSKFLVYDNAGTGVGLGYESGAFALHLNGSGGRFSFFQSGAGGLELMTLLGTGNLGIGDLNPSAKLSLGIDNTASKLLIYDNPGTSVGLGYTNGSFRFHLGGAGRFSFLNNPLGTEVMTVQSSGNVGIGTTSPGSRLDVHGSIQLGSTGQYFAPGGNEDLHIVRGVVNSAAGIIVGTGFSVTKGGTGFFTINFSPGFGGTPAVVVTAQSGIDRIATCTSVSATSAGIWTRDSAGTATDNQFNFIAIGPK